MTDPVVGFGWREVVLGLSAGFTTLLGIVWRRQQQDVKDLATSKCDRNEIISLLDKLSTHIADDKALIGEIREDRKASELSRDELHRKFNKLAKVVVRLDERLAHIGTRAGETLGPIGDDDDDTGG